MLLILKIIKIFKKYYQSIVVMWQLMFSVPVMRTVWRRKLDTSVPVMRTVWRRELEKNKTAVRNKMCEDIMAEHGFRFNANKTNSKIKENETQIQDF
jgi:hypothetical protein